MTYHVTTMTNGTGTHFYISMGLIHLAAFLVLNVSWERGT